MRTTAGEPRSRERSSLAGDPSELPRLLPRPAGGPVALGDHLRRYGPPVSSSPHGRPTGTELLEEIGEVALRGRGGAGFPMALKLAAVAARPGRAVVVGNGTEGEPASAKDKVLLASSPHLVLDGAVAAAEAIGSLEAVIVSDPVVSGIVRDAVAERRRAGMDSVDLRVVDAAPGFVAGEASAVVHWVEQGDALPRLTPPRLAERGLAGRPTLVQNVETLAHVALVARFGAAWFRGVGTPEEPGSMLVTLLGAVHRPGVYEVEIGRTIGSVLELAGGSPPSAGQLLIGGYFGTFAPLDGTRDLPLSRAGLAPIGASPGAGMLAVLPAGTCGLVETARLARYLASESAGQCGPCTFGLPAIAAELESLAAGGPFDEARLARWLAEVEGRGACSHPDGAVRVVRSALRVFAAEVDRHQRGRCSAPTTRYVLPTPRPLR